MADDFMLDTDDLERRMDGALTSLRTEFASLRTGRASASMLEPVMVDAYGSMTPINQVGTVNVPEPRMVTINVWDKGLVGKVEKAIRAGQYAEGARVSMRNVRRDGMDQIKKAKAAGEMSEDDQKIWEGEVEEITKKYIALIDAQLETKQAEIMQV